MGPPGRRWLLPPDATADADWLIAARGIRAFADGLITALLPTYLLDRGFDAFVVGILSTLTLFGSAALPLGVGAVANRIGYPPSAPGDDNVQAESVDDCVAQHVYGVGEQLSSGRGEDTCAFYLLGLLGRPCHR